MEGEKEAREKREKGSREGKKEERKKVRKKGRERRKVNEWREAEKKQKKNG